MMLHDKAGTICLDSDPATKALFINNCNETNLNQKWEWGVVNKTKIDNWETSGRKIL
jgi:hypothetical protein